MNAKKSKKPGAVGYKSPPTHTRFKRGKSGNPKGRRKGQPSIWDLVQREAARFVKVTNNGTVERITKHEVVIRRLFNAAMQDDRGAQRLVLTLLGEAQQLVEAKSQDETDGAAAPARPNEEVIRRILARFEHLQVEEGEERGHER